jgi:hypothetical protein
MIGDSLETGHIDPRLLDHFALFREPGPGPDGPLDDDEENVVAFREEIAAGQSSQAGRHLARLGLVFTEVRRVVLGSDRVMLVIPGSAGLLLHVRNTGRRQGGGSTTDIDGCLEGRPILSSNQTLFGLAPDGVELQPVEFRDGSIGEAVVRHNAYMIDDAGWSPD